ncbi:MAG: anti-sigma factor, partial [Actinomycetota bacterium]
QADRADRSERSWWQRYGAVVAVAACVVLGLAWYAYDSVSDNAARLDAVAARQEQIRRLLDGRQPSMTMIPTGNGPAAGGLVFARDGRAAVVLDGLDRGAEGVYEVWAIRGGKPVPVAAVGDDDWQGSAGQAVVLLEGGVEGVEGMRVSIEPSEPPAGAEGPKGPVVLST